MLSKNKKAKQASKEAANSESRSVPSIIGPDLRFVGDMNTPGEIQFDGTLEGELKSGTLTVGEHATITGSISVEVLHVRGAVIGTIRAKKVRLDASAKVIGDIYHSDLSIETGAYIEGRCIHADNPLGDLDEGHASSANGADTSAEAS
jgi:cytoskeletal protein CcmA (bactofilin family)